MAAPAVARPQAADTDIPRLDLRAVAAMSADEVLAALESSPRGLSESEARRRRARYGLNRLVIARRPSVALRFLAQVTHFFALLLWAAAALAFLGGMPELGWAIIVVILINAVFSFWQEYRAERAVEALQRLLPATALVLRDGEERLVPAEELVPGDVLVLRAGDHISADARLLEQHDLTLVAAALTGEALPVRKTVDPVESSGYNITELPNIVYAGTSVASGTGRAVVVATGMATRFGQIVHLTQQVAPEPTPLQRQLAGLTRTVALLATSIGIIFFTVGVTVMKMPLVLGFLFGIGVIVALVPEGLLPTLTLSLALSVQRMARRNAIVKQLAAVDALGATTVICTDKTGTLTQGVMLARELWTLDSSYEATGTGYDPTGTWRPRAGAAGLSETARLALICGALCNDARLLPPDPQAGRAHWQVVGDPTEGALLIAARKAGLTLEALQREQPRVGEHPFDARRKRMSTLHRRDSGLRIYVKGAPREILALCTQVHTQAGVVPLSPAQRDQIVQATDRLAAAGLRVLALAYHDVADEERIERLLSAESPPEEAERDLVFLGLVGLHDPPRPEVAAAVQQCRTAGIRIFMITGDYGLTAEAIARRIGMLSHGPARIINGPELDRLSDAALSALLCNDEVLFARTSPEHKLRIVTLLRRMGEVVAVTGDGVNDAPALKRADVGIAMGVSGTDVAKEAAAVVLADDNFATIVKAIEEGRAVYANIKKFLTYVFISNVAELMPFIVMMLWGIPLPLTIMQVLSIDLGADVVPALALGMEPPEPGIMEQPPRRRDAPLLDLGLGLRFATLGLVEAGLGLAGYAAVYVAAGWQPGLPFPVGETLAAQARAACQTGIVGGQIGAVFACRSDWEPSWRRSVTANPTLLVGVVLAVLFMAAIVYIPAFQHIFSTAALPWFAWPLMLAGGALVLGIDEARKAILRRVGQRKHGAHRDHRLRAPRLSAGDVAE